MPILSMILAQAALFSTEPLADPMIGVTPDWVLCTHPDDIAKTCMVMATFSKAADGGYSESDRSSIIGMPGLVIEYGNPAYLKGSKLCSVARRSAFDGARIVRHTEGMSLNAEAAALKRISFMYPIEGKEVCSEFFPDGVQFRLNGWVNGKLMDGMEMPARWVSVDDGYQVTGWHGSITTPTGPDRR